MLLLVANRSLIDSWIHLYSELQVLGPECEEVFQQFKSVEVHMKIVNLLRIVLGACVEQVMLLDRLCYLEEQV